MDNTGPYVTYKELFERLFPSTYVSYRSDFTLSAKSTNTFEYADSTFDLAVGDIVCQGAFASPVTVLATGPDKLTLADATNINDGAASVFRTAKTLSEWDMLTVYAMQTIDLYTGQWFNKRTFDTSSPLTFEGKNTPILHLPVPIIEITEMKLNEDENALDSNSYQVFKSRTIPDDRRNPRIKILVHRSATSEIYTGLDTAAFFKVARFTTLAGSFGFLEADGSTPSAIKWATARLVMVELTRDIESAGGTEQQVKREKTDLHEIEYQATSTNTNQSSITGKMTGDDEVDRVILMYKAPFAMGGSHPSYWAALKNSHEYDTD